MPHPALLEIQAHVTTASASSTWQQRLAAVTGRPYSIREDRQALAGLSASASPAMRGRDPGSPALLSCALTSGATAACLSRLPAGPAGTHPYHQGSCHKLWHAERLSGSVLLHAGEQLVLAVEAALAVVADISRGWPTLLCAKSVGRICRGSAVNSSAAASSARGSEAESAMTACIRSPSTRCAAHRPGTRSPCLRNKPPARSRV